MPAGLDANPEPIATPTRRAVIDRAAESVLSAKQHHTPLLVAVDGIDGSGKSTFADELAEALRQSDATVVRATIDSFHNPRAVRHHRGVRSAAGFYFDSHNLEQLRGRLLDPFRRGVGADYRTACFDEPTDQPDGGVAGVLNGEEILLFDGIFACRPELQQYWDVVIHLDGRDRVKLERVARILADRPDGDSAQTPQTMTPEAVNLEAVTDHVLGWVERIDRYSSGMAIYFDLVQPMDRADLVIDNNDLANPRIVSEAEPRDRISPRLASYYEQEAETRAGRPVDPTRSAWRRQFMDLLIAEDRDRVLEIGSGPGRDTGAFADAGFDIVGLDLAFQSMRFLRAEGVNAVQGSLFQLPFPDRCFDGGWTMSTLLHVPDARFDEAMTRITATMRPGAPVGIGLWGGFDREGADPTDTIRPARFFSFRSHQRLGQMLARHGSLELFETMDYGMDDGSVYQFAILRVD